MKDVKFQSIYFHYKDNIIQQIVTLGGSLEKTQSTQRVSYVLEVNGGLSKQRLRSAIKLRYSASISELSLSIFSIPLSY